MKTLGQTLSETILCLVHDLFAQLRPIRMCLASSTCLAPQIDLVRAESFAYDVMIFSETWLQHADYMSNLKNKIV